MAASRDISMNRVWVIDGVLKIAFGCLMFTAISRTPLERRPDMPED